MGQTHTMSTDKKAKEKANTKIFGDELINKRLELFKICNLTTEQGVIDTGKIHALALNNLPNFYFDTHEKYYPSSFKTFVDGCRSPSVTESVTEIEKYPNVKALDGTYMNQHNNSMSLSKDSYATVYYNVTPVHNNNEENRLIINYNLFFPFNLMRSSLVFRAMRTLIVALPNKAFFMRIKENSAKLLGAHVLDWEHVSYIYKEEGHGNYKPEKMIFIAHGVNYTHEIDVRDSATKPDVYVRSGGHGTSHKRLSILSGLGKFGDSLFDTCDGKYKLEADQVKLFNISAEEVRKCDNEETKAMFDAMLNKDGANCIFGVEMSKKLAPDSRRLYTTTVEDYKQKFIDPANKKKNTLWVKYLSDSKEEIGKGLS